MFPKWRITTIRLNFSSSFDVFEDLIIKSVWVDADGQADRSIQLRDDNGNVLQDTIINIPITLPK